MKGIADVAGSKTHTKMNIFVENFNLEFFKIPKLFCITYFLMWDSESNGICFVELLYFMDEKKMMDE